jgi:hypothetical protein
MAIDLFTPILNDRTRSPNFFNGRLLSGEAMTEEQQAQRVARELLAQSVGDGIAHGLEVSVVGARPVDQPAVNVKAGLAVNRSGQLLYLKSDTVVQLVRPAHQAVAPPQLFHACTPPQSGTYVADSGVYLLTLCSAGAGDGLAVVSGLGDTPRGCNIKYSVDAVEVRLLELPIDATTLADLDRLRNAVAYKCFGALHLNDFATDPFAAVNIDTAPVTLLDQLRASTLTDCDVPLGCLYWTATGGIQWLDLWSVRRRVTRTASATANTLLSDTRLAIGEAMVLQFQEQLATIPLNLSSTTIQGRSRFRYLPPLGLLPVARLGVPGFDANVFLTGVPHRDPEFIDAAALSSLAREAVQHPPIDVESGEMLWLYSVWQNADRIKGNPSMRGAVVFASPHTRFRATSRLDLSHWDYSNYSDCNCGS